LPWLPLGVTTQQTGVLVCDQYDDGRIDTREGLTFAFLVTAYHSMAGRTQHVRITADATKCMAVLPVMQGLGIGQDAGMLGSHVDRGASQI